MPDQTTVEAAATAAAAAKYTGLPLWGQIIAAIVAVAGPFLTYLGVQRKHAAELEANRREQETRNRELDAGLSAQIDARVTRMLTNQDQRIGELEQNQRADRQRITRLADAYSTIRSELKSVRVSAGNVGAYLGAYLDLADDHPERAGKAIGSAAAELRVMVEHLDGLIEGTDPLEDMAGNTGPVAADLVEAAAGA